MSCVMWFRRILCSEFSCGCRHPPASPGSAPESVGPAAGKAPGCTSSLFSIGRQKEEAEEKSQLWKGEMKRKDEKEGEQSKWGKRGWPLQVRELWHHTGPGQL